MNGQLPTGEESTGFKATMMAFERHICMLAMKVIDCFAERLSFPPDVSNQCRDPVSETNPPAPRLIHYLGMKDAKPEDFKFWRAGAHGDFERHTLLYGQLDRNSVWYGV